MHGLSEKQREVLGFIGSYAKEHGYAPSIRDIRAFLCVNSTNGVNQHLEALERKGYIKRDAMKSRAIRVIKGIDS